MQQEQAGIFGWLALAMGRFLHFSAPIAPGGMGGREGGKNKIKKVNYLFSQSGHSIRLALLAPNRASRISSARKGLLV
jgi:hypothetical protein